VSKRLLRAAAIAAGLLISSSAFAVNPGDPVPPDTPGAPFPPVSSFDRSGPYATTSERVGLSCTIYRPRTLGQGGVRHPIIIWGNGTGASPSTYGSLLHHWASHGFVVAAANTSNAGTGEEMLRCLDYLIEENAKSSGTYAGMLNPGRVGASGHSQGGGGTIMAGQDPRVTVTAPIQPYTLGLGHRSSSQSNQNGPMFLMTGGIDAIAAPTLNALPVYNRANVPVFWGELRLAGHFEPVGNGGGYRGPSTAWFRYHLMDDNNARNYFYGANCTLCRDLGWSVRKKGMN